MLRQGTCLTRSLAVRGVEGSFEKAFSDSSTSWLCSTAPDPDTTCASLTTLEKKDRQVQNSAIEYDNNFATHVLEANFEACPMALIGEKL